MADKDFQVKNGLVVNSNNYGGANRLTVNATAVLFGNTTSNVTITGSSVVISTPGSTTTFNSNFKPATATLADVSVSVGSIHGANVVSHAQLQANLANFTNTATLATTYQTRAGLSANVATLTSANSTRLNAKLESELNVNNAVTSNSSNSATYSDVAGTVGNNGSSTGSQFIFTYIPQLGTPTYIWGTNDGVNFRPYSGNQFTSIGVGTSAPATTGQITATSNITSGGRFTDSSGTLYPITTLLNNSTLTGNNFPVTGIPSWVTRVTILLKSVNWNESAFVSRPDFGIQLGSGSVYVTTGYSGGAWVYNAGRSSSDFATFTASGLYGYTGIITIHRNPGTFIYSISSKGTRLTTNDWVPYTGETFVTLPSAMDSFRLILNNTRTFTGTAAAYCE